MTPFDKGFDNGIALEHAGDGLLRGRTVPEWANMVGPFGGITAAALVRAIELQPDVHGLPVAVTVNYLAPVDDGDYDIATRAVRTNRSNQHWTMELSQGGEPKTTGTAVFGVRRDTWANTELGAPSVLAPDEAPGRNPPGPVWMKNYDMRYLTGMPELQGGTASDSSETTFWIRDAHERPIDFTSLIAMCDSFYPRVWRRLGQIMPAGTISFTVYLHADAAQLAAQGADFVLARAQAQRFSAGHFDQTAQLWGRDGGLLATSHQLVYFKG